MLLSVTDGKKEKIQKSCISNLEKKSLKIRELASFIGTLTATFWGNKLDFLSYKALNTFKTSALKKLKSNFEWRVRVSKDAFLDLKWLRNNMITISKSLHYTPISKVKYTDGSNIGCGSSF